MKPVVCQSTDFKQTFWVQWIKVLCIHFTYSFSKQKALSKSNDNQWSIIHFVCLTFKCFLVSWKWISKLLQQWGVWLESITFAAKTLTMLELYSFFPLFLWFVLLPIHQREYPLLLRVMTEWVFGFSVA